MFVTSKEAEQHIGPGKVVEDHADTDWEDEGTVVVSCQGTVVIQLDDSTDS